MTTIQETISILKGLLVACHGVEHACNESADVTDHSEAKAAWHKIARQQGRMASELESAVLRLGGDPRHGGLAGTSQSLWPHAETGEQSAADDLDSPRDEAQRQVYRRALQADLPLNVRMLVQRQNVEISAIRRQAQQLEQAESNVSAVNVKTSRFVPRAITWFDF